MTLHWFYPVISWILLTWHQLWNKIGISDHASFLRTSWSWILAIVFLVITIRIVLFPLFVKQIRSQRAMQALQPKVKELQAKHKGDKETLQKELMELYRKEKANPLMGCLPMFLQVPVFLGLFHVLRRLHPDNTLKTLYGWTEDQFVSASHARLFGAPIASAFRTSDADVHALGASVTNVKVIAVLLIAAMITTTFLTSRQMILKTGWSADPQQKMIQRLMLYGIPVTLLISGGIMPLGVVLYWVVNNIISLGQQFWVLKKYPPPPAAQAAAGAGTGGGKGKDAKAAPTPIGRPPAKPHRASTKAISAKRDGGTDDSGDGQVDGRSLAPRPGVKPVNRKRGGARGRAR